MAFAKTAGLQGSDHSYQVHPDAKRYTLRDNGFEETSSGNFQYIRPLDVDPSNKQGIKLKVVISKDLSELKISTTTSNGLRTVNIYKGDVFAVTREKAQFILDNFAERGVLEQV